MAGDDDDDLDSTTTFSPDLIPKLGASDDEGEATLMRPPTSGVPKGEVSDTDATTAFNPDDIPPGEGENPHLIREEWTFEQFEAHIEANPGKIYAILDACVGEVVWDKVDELRALDEEDEGEEPELHTEPRVASLFNGHAAEKYAKVAPYLVRVDLDMWQWIREKLWEQSWGIFLRIPQNKNKTRTHLHSLLMAQNTLGDKIYFRYYDPRMTVHFINACSKRELETVLPAPLEVSIIAPTSSTTLSILRNKKSTATPK